MMKLLLIFFVLFTLYCSESPIIGGDVTDSGNFIHGNITDINGNSVSDGIAVLNKYNNKASNVTVDVSLLGYTPVDTSVIDSVGDYSFEVHEDGVYFVNAIIRDSSYVVTDSIFIDLSNNTRDTITLSPTYLLIDSAGTKDSLPTDTLIEGETLDTLETDTLVEGQTLDTLETDTTLGPIIVDSVLSDTTIPPMIDTIVTDTMDGSGINDTLNIQT